MNKIDGKEILIQYRVQILREVLKIYGPHFIQVEGNSMQPVFGDESTVPLEYPNKAIIKSGNCVMYTNKGNSMVFHRILRFSNNLVTTKGDNEDFIDKVCVKNVIGIYQTRHKKKYRIMKKTTMYDLRIKDLIFKIYVRNGILYGLKKEP